MCPSLLCYWGLTLLMRTSQYWGARGNNTEAFEAHLPLHCSSPSADADDEFGNGVLQARRILGPESPKTCDWFTTSFLHTRTVIFFTHQNCDFFTHQDCGFFYSSELWFFFFFFTKCCAIFFVVDKNLFNASSNIFMSDIHNNLTRHIFHI